MKEQFFNNYQRYKMKSQQTNKRKNVMQSCDNKLNDFQFELNEQYLQDAIEFNKN